MDIARISLAIDEACKTLVFRIEHDGQYDVYTVRNISREVRSFAANLVNVLNLMEIEEMQSPAKGKP